jgi:hypothetical protein
VSVNCFEKLASSNCSARPHAGQQERCRASAKKRQLLASRLLERFVTRLRPAAHRGDPRAPLKTSREAQTPATTMAANATSSSSKRGTQDRHPTSGRVPTTPASCRSRLAGRAEGRAPTRPRSAGRAEAVTAPICASPSSERAPQVRAPRAARLVGSAVGLHLRRLPSGRRRLGRRARRGGARARVGSDPPG